MSFTTADVTTPQVNGHVVLPVVIEGTPNAAGTPDFFINLTDGTATAGWNYGWHGPDFTRGPIPYDIEPGTSTVNVEIPIYVLRWRGVTDFTVTLTAADGNTVGSLGSAHVSILPWDATPVLKGLKRVQRKIDKLTHLGRKFRPHDRVVLRRLYKKEQDLRRALRPVAEL